MSTTTELEREADQLRQQISAAQRRLNSPMPAGMRDELSMIAARYDAVDRQFGLGAPESVGPVGYETPHQYRQRRLAGIIKHSPACKHVRADSLGEAEIALVEERAIRDAMQTAHDPASYRRGELRAIKERDESGRVITRWVGDWHAAFGPFCSAGQVGYIKDPRNPR